MSEIKEAYNEWRRGAYNLDSPEVKHGFTQGYAVAKVRFSKPNLGLATTGQLLAELKARAEVNGTINYRTVEEGDDTTRR